MRILIVLITCFTFLLSASNFLAQETEVPRTRTFPGIQNSAFPYSKPEEVGLSSEKLDHLAEEIESWVANGDLVGGELLIIKNGKAVFHEAYGWSDRERRFPVERNSIWSIKSMSKPFTATAILILAEECKLFLDDPVNRYITNFAGDERTTIRHLLSHTSGYRNADLGDPIWDVHTSILKWVEDWASRKPSGTLGTYEYTDFGFAAAGYIVEKVSGVSIGPFTEEQIAGPLGLEDTSTSFSDDPEWRERLNPWYWWIEEAGGYELRWSAKKSQWPFYPAAWGMFSTAMDYAGFMQMWMNGGQYQKLNLLSEETVEEALREHAQGGLGYWPYGYGWFVNEEAGTNGMPSAFVHGGGDGTIAIAFPGENAMIIFLTHSRGVPHGRAIVEALGMMEIFEYQGMGLVLTDKQDINTVERVDDKKIFYTGFYKGRESIAEVRDEGGLLHLRITRTGTQPAGFWKHLAPLGNHSFVPGRYIGNQLVATNPDQIVILDMKGEQANALHLISGTDTISFATRVDPKKIAAERKARMSRISIADLMEQTLEIKGVKITRALHRELLVSKPDSIRFGDPVLDVPLLGNLGGRLMNENRIEEAVAVFEMNVEAYPEIPRARGALAKAYREAGRLEEAWRSYEIAVELAEQQGDQNLREYREKLKQVIKQLEKQ